MPTRLSAVVVAWIIATLIWIVAATIPRLHSEAGRYQVIKDARDSWALEHKQLAPVVYICRPETEPTVSPGQPCPTPEPTESEARYHPEPLKSSEVMVRLSPDESNLKHRGFTTYRVAYSGKYRICNPRATNRDIYFQFVFPANDGTYENFRFVAGGQVLDSTRPGNSQIVRSFNLNPGEEKLIEISYESPGIENWSYVPGADLADTHNLSLTVISDFDDVTFAGNSLLPTSSRRTETGLELKWNYDQLISKSVIGISVPSKITAPGLASRWVNYTPLALLLFLALTFTLITVRRVAFHPVNFLFMMAAFLSYPFLLGYMAGHLNLYLAMGLCCAASVSVVIAYSYLVTRLRSVSAEVGAAQLAYLMLFSLALLSRQYTGLIVVITCVLTLFAIMLVTSRVDWSDQFGHSRGVSPAVGPPPGAVR